MKKFKEWLWIAVILIIIYASFYLLGIGCPLKFITGVSCAGCGMTRAYISLLRGDIAAAFRYHPLFILPPLVLLLILCKKKLPAKVYSLFLFTAIAAFLIIYVLRLLDPNDAIVVFEPENGFIFKVLSLFTGRR